MRLAAWPVRLVVVGLLGGLAVLSVQLFRADEQLRSEADAFARKFRLADRRPEYVDTAAYAAAGDLAFSPLGDAVLEDALGTKRIAGLAGDRRRLWIEAMQDLGDEISGARDLMLSAVSKRPGWAYHYLMLGQLVYVDGRRFSRPELVKRPEEWMKALRASTGAAPGDDATWAFLGAALLETWTALPAGSRADHLGVLEHSFADPRFIETAFAAAVSLLGIDTASKLLPEESRSLLRARQIAGRTDVRAAARLFERWETAERKERVRILQRIEDRVRRDDLYGLRSACREWLAHPFREFDDAESRRQLARVVELWPDEGMGEWSSDPRADLVRYLLDGRQHAVSGHAMARLVSTLANAPDPVQAQVMLLANDRYALGQVIQRAPTLGVFEWTPFLVQLARTEIDAGNLSEAASALSKVAPSARAECDVLLERRRLARARDERDELADVSAQLTAACPSSLASEGWSRKGSLPLCIDPERDGNRVVAVRLTTPSVSLVSYGWDGGRVGTVLVDRDHTLSIPLAGLSGRRVLFIAPVAGPPVSFQETRLLSAAEGLQLLEADRRPRDDAEPR